MHITYYGHSAFLIDVDGGTLLLDPFISGNPLSQAKIAIETIKTDVVLVSHGHDDHVGDASAIAKQNDALIVTNYEIATWFGKQDIEKTVGLNYGGTADLGFARAKLVPAWHSSTLPNGSTGGNPGGFVVTHAGGTFYFSGDTCITMEMQLIGELSKPDIAFLCIGGHFTMDVTEAVHAAKLLQVKRVVGMHYDTFPPIAIDQTAAKQAFQSAGIELILLPLHQRTAL